MVNLSKSEKWGQSKKTDIFGQLCLDERGKQLWNFISMYKPHILSAYVEESFDPNCIPGKTKWLKTNVQSQQIELIL